MELLNKITDYQQTQRVLILIDMNPLLYLIDPKPYLTTLLSLTKTLLSFSSLSSSLFSFKLFFSSLSPLLSSSKLPLPSLSLSFDHPHSVFNSLSSLLSDLSLPQEFNSVPSVPRACLLASSLRQLLHDYAWDSVDLGTDGFDSVSVVNSSLVVLFSPISRVLNCLNEFFDVGSEDLECLRCFDGFNRKFRGFFENVKDAFVSKGIYLSWIDVKCEVIGCGVDECDLELLGFFERGIRDWGWGFCSSDFVVLGSSLVPFGLIYPRIGVSFKCLDFGESSRRIRSQFCLEIIDANGKPLECKCSDLELGELNLFSEFFDYQSVTCKRQERLWEGFKDGAVKLRVKAVKRYDACKRMEGLSVSPVLVRELSKETKKDGKDNSDDLFEDNVIKILESDNLGVWVMKRSAPLWQIFISFLYRDGYCAYVSLENGNGNSLVGILKPFTISTALLSFVGDEFQRGCIIEEFDGANSRQKDTMATTLATDSKHISRLATSEIHGKKRKREKKNFDKIKEITWSDFCQAALEHCQINLEDVYVVRFYNKSKKLKFMKCWMKQIKQSNFSCSSIPDGCRPVEDIRKEEVHIVTDQESEQLTTPCASFGEEALTGASGVQDEIAIDLHSETIETFFNDLPHKIRQGLESEEVDLRLLAERLVKSSIYWLHQKVEKENASETESPVEKSNDASAGRVAVELTKLLLKEPKELDATFKCGDPSVHGENQNADITSENIVREYELQILFRMEILQSELGASIGESTKQRFVKQICSFLETIQNLQGGFFGDWNLDEYIRKILKSRYCQTLEDVVHKIYAKMDLLLFEDEEEFSNSLLNGEDSNQLQRGNFNGDDMDENYRTNDFVLAECESASAVNNECPSAQIMNREECAHKLNEVKEKRQRARRFASFTTWVPDLQRVWAPKQARAIRPKSDPKQRRASFLFEDKMVESTPMAGDRHSCKVRGSIGSDYKDDGTSLCGSVSKALFQDD